MCCYKRTVKNMDELYRVHFITRPGQIVQYSIYSKDDFRIDATRNISDQCNVCGIVQLSRRYNEPCEGVS